MPLYQIDTPHGTLELDHDGPADQLLPAVNTWVIDEYNKKGQRDEASKWLSGMGSPSPKSQGIKEEEIKPKTWETTFSEVKEDIRRKFSPIIGQTDLEKSQHVLQPEEEKQGEIEKAGQIIPKVLSNSTSATETLTGGRYQAPQIPIHPTDGILSAAGKSVANDIIGFVDFALSPVGLGTAELATEGKLLTGAAKTASELAQLGVAVKFTHDLINTATSQTKAALDPTKTPAERTAAGVNALAASLGAFVITAHEATGGRGGARAEEAHKQSENQVKDTIRQIPTEHLEAFKADDQFSKKWAFSKQIIDDELKRRGQTIKPPEQIKAEQAGLPQTAEAIASAPKEAPVEAPKTEPPPPPPTETPAHTEEFPPQKTTGLKKATVKDERLQRGLEDLPQEERQQEGPRVQAAEDRIKSDPSAAPKLVSRIVDDGQRAITTDEAATLLVERNRVMNERRSFEKEFCDPETTPSRKAQVIAHLNELENQVDRLDKAQRAAGSSWGRTGKMYQRLIREDYTLEAMERRRRIAKDAPLTEEERQILKEQADKIEALQKTVEEGQNTQKQLEQAQELTRVHEATIKELQSQPKHAPEVLRIAKNTVARWRAEADAVQNDIFSYLARNNETGAVGDLSKGGRKKSFSDANNANKAKTDFITKVALEIRATIGELGIDAAERGTELNRIIIEKYGDGISQFIDRAKALAFKQIKKDEKDSKVKKVLKTGTKKAEKTPAEIKAGSKAEATAGEELNHKTVYDLARAHIQEELAKGNKHSGIEGENATIKAVHADLKDAYPDLTEDQVRQLYSEYGKVKFPSKEEDKVRLSEYRRIGQLDLAIKDLKKGLDAKHTGAQREKASQAIREKQKELNDLLKKHPGPPSPEKLATNLEARKTRLRNSIEDLDKRLRTGEGPTGRTPPPPLDAEGERLMAERDAMKAKLKEIEEAEHPGPTPEERYNATRLKAIAKQSAEIQERLRTGNYEKPARPLPPEKNAATIKAYTELQKQKQQLQEADEKAKTANRTPVQKLIDTVVTKPYHFLTAIKIIGHGTVGMMTHAGGLAWRPSKATIYWQNFGRQFGMWVKPEYHERLIYNLENDPEYHKWKDAGASIDPYKTYTDYGMYSKWVPKALLNLGKTGQRGFDALKLTRLELNKADWKNVSPEIKNDPRAALEARKVIAEINNKATGVLKGNSALANAARNPMAQAAFFAPKLYASRWTRVLLDPIKTTATFLDWNNATPVEKMAATTKAKHAGEFAATYIGGLVTNQAILSATGSQQKINFTDPTKSDWLKFKIGGKEISADGGLLDPLRLVGQLVWGDLIKTRTNSEQYRDGTRFDKVGHDIFKYLRGKANPSLGIIIDASTGSDFEGRPLPFSNEKPRFKDQTKYKLGEWLMKQGPIPISGGVQVAYDEMRKRGLSDIQAMDIIKGAAVAVAGMTGVHITTDYVKKKR